MDASPFRYSLNASTIRPTPLLDQIRVAGHAGYEGIELWHDAIDGFLEQGGALKDIRQCLDDNALHVPSTIYLADWFDATDGDLDRVMSECERRMEQAATLGAPYVIAGPPMGSANIQIGAERYRQLLDRGERLGALPAMEFLGFVEQVNTIEAAIGILNQANDSRGTTILDPFHIFRGGGSVDSIALLQPQQIAVSHFNDTPAQPKRLLQHDEHRVMPGDGHLDLRRYVQLLKNIGFHGWLSLELFNASYWAQDPLETARLGLEKMRALAEG